SRRRHTRFSRDWSSDVCSSDLNEGEVALHHVHEIHEEVMNPGAGNPSDVIHRLVRRTECTNKTSLEAGPRSNLVNLLQLVGQVSQRRATRKLRSVSEVRENATRVVEDSTKLGSLLNGLLNEASEPACTVGGVQPVGEIGRA